MKKILSLMIAFMAMFSISVSAMTYEQPKFFDNTYITLKGGATGLMHPRCNGYQNFGHTIQGQAALEFGKWITPKFGVGIEGTVGFDNGSQPWSDGVNPWTWMGNFQGRNWVNHVDVLALAKFNLNNIFRGYRGYADKVEFVPTVGIGWTHGWVYGEYYDVEAEDIFIDHSSTQHENHIMTKYALDVNINLNAKWQVNVEPFVAYNLTGNYQGYKNWNPRFDSHNAWWGLNVGVTYKIGKEFTPCPYKYTQADVDKLNAEINDLRARKPEVVKEVQVVEKVVTKTVNDADQFVVFFAHASTELTNDAKATLNEIGENSIVNVIGSASPDGNADFNASLAEQRAEVVKNYLENRGVRVNNAHGVGTDLGARVAVVIVK